MISFGVIIRPDDGHTIFSPESKQILNYGKDIKIGNHVWLGEQVIILKGAVIPDNTIVGAKSLVNKQFQPGGGISSWDTSKNYKNQYKLVKTAAIHI